MDSNKNVNISNRSTIRMESLPNEVTLDIFSRLPVSSLMRSRFVSPFWQNLTYDPNLINLHCSNTAKSNTCLIIHRSFPLGNQLHFVDFSDDDNKTVARKFQTPFPTPMPQTEFKVVGSANGILCLSYSKDHDIIQICNPFTRSYKNLPPISNKFNAERVVVGFGYHPVTKEYKVVRIVYYSCVEPPECDRSEVQVYSLVTNDWRSIGKINYQIVRWSTEPSLVNGKLHWLTKSGPGRNSIQKLISFDIADEQFREVPTPNDQKPQYFYNLAVLGGCLSMLFHHRSDKKKLEIWVMKEYNVIESWSKEYEIDIDVPFTRLIGTLYTDSQLLAYQVLCLTKNGRILLMRHGALASYDPEREEVENVILEGAPDAYHAVVHEGSLAWIENI